MYHTLMERHMIKLSNDMIKIKMGKRILFKISREFDLFPLHYFGKRYLT